MPAVQTDYPERIGEYYEGQVINPHNYDADTYIAEASIGFGRAVKRGTGGDKSIVAGVEPSAGGSAPYPVNEFYGITIKDPTRDPEDNDTYRKGAHVSVMWRGDVVVKVKAAVNAGNTVKVDTADGLFTSADASASVRTVTGARFMKDAAANGLTVLRLYGNEQQLATT